MTRVALLWHMHQPFYQDLRPASTSCRGCGCTPSRTTGAWSRCCASSPASRSTFNLVPSLLVQLEAFARDEARDRHLEIGLKPADELSDEERAFCVEQFFHAHRPRMIDPYPRYAELLARRGSQRRGPERRAQAAQFSTDDMRDLQVWHKLAWIDRGLLRARRPRSGRWWRRDAALPRRTRPSLRAVELELLRRVVPEYRDAARARADRALDVAVLSPDPAAAVRHRRLPAHASRSRGCRASASVIPRTPPSS